MRCGIGMWLHSHWYSMSFSLIWSLGYQCLFQWNHVGFFCPVTNIMGIDFKSYISIITTKTLIACQSKLKAGIDLPLAKWCLYSYRMQICLSYRHFETCRGTSYVLWLQRYIYRQWWYLWDVWRTCSEPHSLGKGLHLHRIIVAWRTDFIASIPIN